MHSQGYAIASQINDKKYKTIVMKLLNKEELNETDKEFLRKKGVLFAK